MDPFMEDMAEWAGVHTRLINSISDQIADLVAPNFSVKIEQRVYITTPDEQQRQSIAPDLYIIQSRQPSADLVMSSGITAPALVEPLYDLEIRDRYIEVRDKHSREVVTTIELLSPFNKTSKTPGREAFMQKRHSVMISGAHWVEIDLLRGGERPVEVAGKSDYYALLKRGGTFGPFEVWYVDLRDSLPTIAIPLRPPFDDVALNLQAALEDTYTRGHYADDLDYSVKAPAPALRPADANWVQAQVAAWLANR